MWKSYPRKTETIKRGWISCFPKIKHTETRDKHSQHCSYAQRADMFALKRQKSKCWRDNIAINLPENTDMAKANIWVWSFAAGADEQGFDTSTPNQRARSERSGLWRESTKRRHHTCQLNWCGTSMLAFMRTNVSFQGQFNLSTERWSTPILPCRMFHLDWSSLSCKQGCNSNSFGKLGKLHRQIALAKVQGRIY